MRRPAAHTLKGLARLRRARRAAALLLLFGWATPSAPAAAGEIEVQVHGVATARGEIVVALFSGDEHWLDMSAADELRVLPAPEPETPAAVRFADLAPGEYAVAVLHDLNGNRKLDMRWFPFPKPREPSGVSGNEVPRVGPPRYQKARFTLGGDESMQLDIDLQH